MQLQGLMLMLFMLIMIPLMILSANHNVFFIVFAVVLIISSIRNLYMLVFRIYPEPLEEKDELMEDLEDMLNIDLKKFGIGTKVVKNLIVILFLFYCTFYVNVLWLRVITSIVIMYWSYDIINSILEKPGSLRIQSSRRLTEKLVSLLVNSGTLVLIVLTACNKFIRQ